MQRRIFATAILFSMLAAPAGLYCYWWYKLQRVKKEVKNSFLLGIDRETLVCLRIAEKDATTVLRWEQKGEFEYQRQLYDVVDSLRKRDTIYYWCWWDRKETKFRNHLKTLLAETLEQDSSQRENRERLQTFFKTLFCAAHPDVSWQLSPPIPERTRPPMWQNDARVSFDLPPPAPPPKVV